MFQQLAQQLFLVSRPYVQATSRLKTQREVIPSCLHHIAPKNSDGRTSGLIATCAVLFDEVVEVSHDPSKTQKVQTTRIVWLHCVNEIL